MASDVGEGREQFSLTELKIRLVPRSQNADACCPSGLKPSEDIARKVTLLIVRDASLLLSNESIVRGYQLAFN